MKEPLFIQGEQDYFKMLRYRLSCVKDDEEGMIIEDGKEYPISRWGNFVGSSYPEIDNLASNLINEIILEQIAKRKAEKTKEKQ